MYKDGCSTVPMDLVGMTLQQHTLRPQSSNDLTSMLSSELRSLVFCKQEKRKTHPRSRVSNTESDLEVR